MSDFWPACGYVHLELTPQGWLKPTEAYLRLFLDLPELALLPESCRAEIALHQLLRAAPVSAVSAKQLGALKDADARANYAMFLAFRDALLAAGSLEAYYLGLMRSQRIDVPPLFIDAIVQAVLRHLLDACDDAFQARAAELLFRPQRLTLTEGRLLCADLEAVDMLQETAGLGSIGRLLLQAQAPLRKVEMAVLTPENVSDYWQRSGRHLFALDLTHEISNDLGHGLSFTLIRSQSGLKALSRVMEAWIGHFLGCKVKITPLQQIDDPAWRWHVGLDVEAMRLLNDLYEDRPVDAERMQRLISLFRLEFDDAAELNPVMAAGGKAKPVYLGLAMNAEQTLRLKPQNLLLNLPLAALM